MIPDGISWQQIATIGATLLATLVAYVVRIFTNRLEDHENTDTLRFTKLFDKQSELVDSVNKGFRELDQTINGIHVKLLEQINKPHHRQDDN